MKGDFSPPNLFKVAKNCRKIEYRPSTNSVVGIEGTVFGTMHFQSVAPILAACVPVQDRYEHNSYMDFVSSSSVYRVRTQRRTSMVIAEKFKRRFKQKVVTYISLRGLNQVQGLLPFDIHCSIFIYIAKRSPGSSCPVVCESDGVISARIFGGGLGVSQL
eukprot:gene16321-4974_t